MEAFAKRRIASFRVNTLKSKDQYVLETLAGLNIPVQPIAELPGVYFLDREHEYALKGTSLFREGYIYMQTLSSMLPVLALAPKAGEKILDVCSAPGSKTTQIAAITNNEAEIVALEQNQIRYDKLLHNIKLQEADSIVTHKTEARKFLNDSEEEFDAILLDAPCSAEGRIWLEDEKTFGFFSVDNIERKAELQKELLASAFLRLKIGGRLIYSTCTLAPEENEGVLQTLITVFPQAKIVPVKLPVFSEFRKGMSEFQKTTYDAQIQNSVRVIPSGRFEGFFIASITKV